MSPRTSCAQRHDAADFAAAPELLAAGKPGPHAARSEEPTAAAAASEAERTTNSRRVDRRSLVIDDPSPWVSKPENRSTTAETSLAKRFEDRMCQPG